MMYPIALLTLIKLTKLGIIAQFGVCGLLPNHTGAKNILPQFNTLA